MPLTTNFVINVNKQQGHKHAILGFKVLLNYSTPFTDTGKIKLIIANLD